LLIPVETQSLIDLDWSDIGHQWIVCVIGERVVGCLQVLPGKPMGRLEHMGLDDSLEGMQRARVTKLLLDTGYKLLHRSGSKAAMGFVPFDLKHYKRALKKRGGIVVSSGNFMLRRLV